MGAFEELQIISKIIHEKNYKILTRHGLEPKHFQHYNPEITFIVDYFSKYNSVPDAPTIEHEFMDREFSLSNDVSGSSEYLAERIFEEFDYVKLKNVLQESAKLANTDSRKSIEYIRNNLHIIQPTVVANGIDIIHEGATQRYDRYLERKNATSDKVDVIKTGFAELDEVFFGWEKGEELVTILGRSNQGKSWLGLKFLMEAWKQGKRVGLYSGEMSALQQGYRFDTMLQHFSNAKLVRGYDVREYKDFIENLKRHENPFFIITQSDLKGKATVSNLESFCQRNELDILGVDQFSLMEDMRAGRGDPERIKLGHISADLYLMSSYCQIPIIAMCQANREAAKKANTNDNLPPQLEDVRESDDIAQNSSRMISLKQSRAGLILNVIKNRGGAVGGKFLYSWDKDLGYFNFQEELIDGGGEHKEELNPLQKETTSTTTDKKQEPLGELPF